MKTGAELIAEERRRQVEIEGFTPARDSMYKDEELLDAAHAYISDGRGLRSRKVPLYWPWRDCDWKPDGNYTRTLIKAGALVAAEIDRRLVEEKNDEPVLDASVEIEFSYSSLLNCFVVRTHGISLKPFDVVQEHSQLIGPWNVYKCNAVELGKILKKYPSAKPF